MTNMMNGAVAIYGGVGVMEIRQPLPQAVESVAQAVEDLAVNAHISLRELKSTIAAVIEKKLPKYAQLMEMNPVVAARTVVDGAKLTAYENGYAVYEQDGAHTVMAIDRCGDYRYDFNDGTYEVVPAEVFEDAEWSVRLVMEGERRMESNRNKTVAINEAASLDCDGSDWSDAVMVDFMDEENAEMLAEEELSDIKESLNKAESQNEQELYQFMLEEKEKKCQQKWESLEKLIRAIWAIPHANARAAVVGFYLDGKALKEICDLQDHVLGVNRARHFKKLGLELLALELRKLEEKS